MAAGGVEAELLLWEIVRTSPEDDRVSLHQAMQDTLSSAQLGTAYLVLMILLAQTAAGLFENEPHLAERVTGLGIGHAFTKLGFFASGT